MRVYNKYLILHSNFALGDNKILIKKIKLIEKLNNNEKETIFSDVVIHADRLDGTTTYFGNRS